MRPLSSFEKGSKWDSELSGRLDGDDSDKDKVLDRWLMSARWDVVREGDGGELMVGEGGMGKGSLVKRGEGGRYENVNDVDGLESGAERSLHVHLIPTHPPSLHQFNTTNTNVTFIRSRSVINSPQIPE